MDKHRRVVRRRVTNLIERLLYQKRKMQQGRFDFGLFTPERLPHRSRRPLCTKKFESLGG